jgi:hypothetical protein
MRCVDTQTSNSNACAHHKSHNNKPVHQQPESVGYRTSPGCVSHGSKCLRRMENATNHITAKHARCCNSVQLHSLLQHTNVAAHSAHMLQHEARNTTEQPGQWLKAAQLQTTQPSKINQLNQARNSQTKHRTATARRAHGLQHGATVTVVLPHTASQSYKAAQPHIAHGASAIRVHNTTSAH